MKDFKIWGLENVFISVYVVNQYHTKSAVSGFLLQKSARLKCDIKLLQQ